MTPVYTMTTRQKAQLLELALSCLIAPLVWDHLTDEGTERLADVISIRYKSLEKLYAPIGDVSVAECTSWLSRWVAEAHEAADDDDEITLLLTPSRRAFIQRLAELKAKRALEPEPATQAAP